MQISEERVRVCENSSGWERTWEGEVGSTSIIGYRYINLNMKKLGYLNLNGLVELETCIALIRLEIRFIFRM
jgi:hypothetical protein